MKIVAYHNNFALFLRPHKPGPVCKMIYIIQRNSKRYLRVECTTQEKFTYFVREAYDK